MQGLGLRTAGYQGSGFRGALPVAANVCNVCDERTEVTWSDRIWNCSWHGFVRSECLTATS